MKLTSKDVPDTGNQDCCSLFFCDNMHRSRSVQAEVETDSGTTPIANSHFVKVQGKIYNENFMGFFSEYPPNTFTYFLTSFPLWEIDILFILLYHNSGCC